MANDENKIILEFPATNVEIEFGETITFDNISGFLDSERVTYNGESLTEEIAHLENDKADTSYVDTELAKKMNKANPTGTGSFSLNRKANTTVGSYSVTAGYRNTASGTASHAESWQTTASGDASHAEGESTIASAYAAHSEGETTTASGDNSHAEGKNSIANGNVSHAEGENNTASGYGSHAEGYGNTASGLMAHAEGVTTESSGYGSHSEGVGTIANHIGQHVFGAYNVADPSTAQPTSKGNYVEIVGNGTNDDRRRNARTLDWSGNETLMGDLTFNGNKSLTSEISRLDGRIDNLPEPMVFKGTLGVGGTIQTLPTASASNEGWTYKVITAGTYAGTTAKVGDVFTSDGSSWVLIPSGDEDSDTWRAIKVNGVEKLGNGISSGAVDFEDTANVKFGFDANGNKISATLSGIYTSSEVNNLLDDKADADNTYTKEQVDDIVYNILPDDTASGSVANFETDLELPIKSLEIDVNAVQESGTPTPASPLPISGWSEINLVHCGANLCNQTDIVGTYPTKYTVDTDGSIKTVGNLGLSDVLWTNKSKVSGVLNVIFVSKYQNTGSVGIRPKIIYTDGTNSVIYTTNTQDYSTRNLLTNSAKTVDKIVVDHGTNNPTSFYLMVTLDTSATTYEPYNGNTTLINLGGTYYGGNFTQDKDGHRQFEATQNMVDLASLTKRGWEYSTQFNCFYHYLTPSSGVENQAKDKFNALCSNYRFVGRYASLVENSCSYIYNTAIAIRDSSFADLEAFRDGINGELVYELATPIVIDLPDGEPITALNGVNNVFCDSGDTSVVFKDSVNGYVEKKIASVQALILS